MEYTSHFFELCCTSGIFFINWTSFPMHHSSYKSHSISFFKI